MPESTPSGRSYADAAGELDDALDARLAEIRRQSDAGVISLAKAADMRVAALERHVDAIQRLRAEYFGTESGG